MKRILLTLLALALLMGAAMAESEDWRTSQAAARRALASQVLKDEEPSEELLYAAGYKDCWLHSEGLIEVRSHDGLCGLIDATGTEVTPLKYDNIHSTREGMTVVRKNGLYGYIDQTGAEVVPPRYDYAEYFHEGMAWVMKDGLYGFIDKTGAEVVPPQYGNAGDFHEGMACVVKGGLYGFIDQTGAEVVPPRYNDAGYFREGMACVEKGGLYGFIDKTGVEVVPPQYGEAESFDGGFAMVCRVGLWGLIDKSGNQVIEPKYANIRGFCEGLAAAEDPEKEKWGYIDMDGAWVIKPKYRGAEDFTRFGWAVAHSNKTSGVIDRTGKWVLKLDPEYEVSISEDDGVVSAIKDYDEDTRVFYDLSSGEAKPATILTASMDLTDYMPFTGKKVAKLEGKPTLAHRVSEEHRLPCLDGATALFPVYSAFVEALYPDDTRYEAYDKTNPPLVSPLITCTKTNVAYERLIKHEADIIFVAQPSDEELQMAADHGEEFDLLPFGREAFVFVVNQQNPCEGLALNEIRWIYTGLITDWSEVGVEGLGEIIPYQRPKNSGSQTALEALMDDMPLMEAPTEVVAWDMGDILETVEYRNLPNALGYSFRFFCTDMMKSDVKLLAIDGVEPTVENIRAGTYPLCSTLYAIRLKSNTENPNVNALWDWLQTDQAAELIEKSGYVSGT